MHLSRRRDARERLRVRLTLNQQRIETSLADTPNAVEGREALWMARHHMQRELKDLT